MQLQDIKELEFLKQIARENGLNLSNAKDFERAELLAMKAKQKASPLTGRTKKQGIVRVDTIKAF